MQRSQFQILFIFLCVVSGPLSSPAQTTNSFAISSLIPSTAGWKLAWPQTGTGSAYTVQFQDTFQDVIWRLPASDAPFPTPSNQWVDREVTNSSRFYRVVSVPEAARGKLLSVTYSNTLSISNLAFLLAVGITPQYNVRLYKVDYE